MCRKMTVAFLLPLFIAACAAWQTAQPIAPETPRQALYHALVYFHASLQAYSDLDQQGVLTEEVKAKVVPLFRQAYAALKVASGLVDASPDDALAQVKMAQKMLEQIRLILSSQ